MILAQPGPEKQEETSGRAIWETTPLAAGLLDKGSRAVSGYPPLDSRMEAPIAAKWQERETAGAGSSLQRMIRAPVQEWVKSSRG